MIEPEQVRAARAMLKLGVRDLAEMTGMAANTISRFENSGAANAETLRKIERALHDAGVQLIAADDNGGVGVRFRP